MGFIASPYRVLYEAVGFRTGLTDVQAAILKPDNSIAGVFPMMECPTPFSGRYYFDYITSSSDPQGEYFAMIVSPSEAQQQTLRISLYKGQQSPSILSGATAITGFVLPDDNITSYTNNDNILGIVTDQNVEG